MNDLRSVLKLIFIVSASLFSGCAQFHEGPSQLRAVLPKNFDISIGGHFGSTYEIRLDGDHLYYTEESGNRHRARRIRPSVAAWQQFWYEVGALNIWRWRSKYEQPKNEPISDGTQWHINIGYLKQRVTSEGDNMYPSDENPRRAGLPTAESTGRFNKFTDAVQQLIGGLPFK